MLSEQKPAFDLSVFVSDHRNKVGPLQLSIILKGQRYF